MDQLFSRHLIITLQYVAAWQVGKLEVRARVQMPPAARKLRAAMCPMLQVSPHPSAHNTSTPHLKHDMPLELIHNEAP